MSEISFKAFRIKNNNNLDIYFVKKIQTSGLAVIDDVGKKNARVFYLFSLTKVAGRWFPGMNGDTAAVQHLIIF